MEKQQSVPTVDLYSYRCMLIGYKQTLKVNNICMWYICITKDSSLSRISSFCTTTPKCMFWIQLVTFPWVTDARAFRYASITNEGRDIFKKISQLFGLRLHPRKSTLHLLFQKNTHKQTRLWSVWAVQRASERVSMLPGRLSPGRAHNPVWLLKHAGGGCCICV